ncbi:MAG: aminotransferase class IV [Planctomycetota bacterium]
MNETVYINGRIVPASEARVSVFDAGFTHAAGLFETMFACNGRILWFSDHIERMLSSARALDMPITMDVDAVKRGALELLAANALSEARMRITVTAGRVPRPGEEAPAPPEPTIVITASPAETYATDLYKHGMRVCICPYKQSRFNPLAGHKTLAYLPRLLAMREAAKRRCNEALWFNTENQLAEGSVCNVFTVLKGTLITPPLDTPVLPGTVRKSVLELAKRNGIRTEERGIIIDDLLASEEVFLTGSIMRIMPVTAIEKHEVGSGKPGEVTKRLSDLYAESMTEECGRDE